MRPRFLRVVISVIACMVVGFALLRGSISVWGSWWRLPGMPTAEEWSALFGASALIALGFAWWQIRQVDQSNLALIASNDLSRQVNIEAVRPRVQVELAPNRIVKRDRGGPAEGTLYIALRNIGASPAFDLVLTVNPPFTSLDKFFKPGMMSEHFAMVNGAFDGEVHFDTLYPGKTYIWFLGRVPELFDADTGIPRRWEVTAEYKGMASTETFRELIVLDLDVEKRIELPVDPLVRIGKDIETVGTKLEAIRRAVPSEFALDDDSIAALRNRGSGFRRGSVRIRRPPTWRRRLR